MNSYVFLLTVVLATVTAQQVQEKRAIVVVTGPTGVKGNITFTQNKNQVTVTGMVSGLTKGLHGFHVHEKGDISNGCVSTGGHFNPEKQPHGGPQSEKRHVGDLGNIEADDQGVAIINLTDTHISLTNPKRNIIGRAIVIHDGVDNFGQGGKPDSLTTGSAGGRVACGVIGTL